MCVCMHAVSRTCSTCSGSDDDGEVVAVGERRCVMMMLLPVRYMHGTAITAISGERRFSLSVQNAVLSLSRKSEREFAHGRELADLSMVYIGTERRCRECGWRVGRWCVVAFGRIGV